MENLSRRRVLTAGLAVPSLLLARNVRAQAASALSLGIWGDQGSIIAYRNLIAKYRAIRPDIEVKLEVTPFGQYYQALDIRLAGDQAPDIFRLEYQVVGRYARSRSLMNLSPHFDATFGAAFAAPFWRAVNHEGKTFALPQNTDTLGVFYNADLFHALGITPPAALGDSWSWSDFMHVAHTVAGSGRVQHAFAMLWQDSQAYRWLPFLFQHGGRLLGADFRSPDITSAAGIETIAWTQSWFKEGLVPPSTSVKSHEQPSVLFASGAIGYFIGGDWQMAFLANNAAGFEWGATFMPRDRSMASDLGGSCTAVRRTTRQPEAAIDFLRFLSSEEAQRDFVLDGQFLPVRSRFIDIPLPYSFRPEVRRVFLQQASTVPPALAETVVLPEFSRINQRMADQLDLAFTSGQSAAATAEGIAASIRSIMSG